VKFRFKIPTPTEIRRTLRYHKLQVVHRSRDPHPAAASFAIGVFLGLMPISVFATVLAVVLPRRFNLRTIPCVAGTLTSNWITAPFIVAVSAMMGQFLTTGHIVGFKAMLPPEGMGLHETFLFFLDQGWAFMLGITVVSFLGAFISYPIVYWAVKGAIKLRQIKVMERMRSHIHLPHVHLPHVNLPHVNLPHVNLPHVNLPHVNLPHVNLPHVHLPHVHLSHPPRHDATDSQPTKDAPAERT
jgi:uncharacterized protein (DUF2062 family)